MWYTLSQRTYRARKKHKDDGFHIVRGWVHNSWEFEKLPVEQQIIIVDLVNAPDAHIIFPGDRYEYSFNVGDGDKRIFKTKERFANIMSKFKIHEEE